MKAKTFICNALIALSILLTCPSGRAWTIKSGEAKYASEKETTAWLDEKADMVSNEAYVELYFAQTHANYVFGITNYMDITTNGWSIYLDNSIDAPDTDIVGLTSWVLQFRPTWNHYYTNGSYIEMPGSSGMDPMPGPSGDYCGTTNEIADAIMNSDWSGGDITNCTVTWVADPVSFSSDLSITLSGYRTNQAWHEGPYNEDEVISAYTSFTLELTLNVNNYRPLLSYDLDGSTVDVEWDPTMCTVGDHGYGGSLDRRPTLYNYMWNSANMWYSLDDRWGSGATMCENHSWHLRPCSECDQVRQLNPPFTKSTMPYFQFGAAIGVDTNGVDCTPWSEVVYIKGTAPEPSYDSNTKEVALTCDYPVTNSPTTWKFYSCTTSNGTYSFEGSLAGTNRSATLTNLMRWYKVVGVDSTGTNCITEWSTQVAALADAPEASISSAAVYWSWSGTNPAYWEILESGDGENFSHCVYEAGTSRGGNNGATETWYKVRGVDANYEPITADSDVVWEQSR